MMNYSVNSKQQYDYFDDEKYVYFDVLDIDNKKKTISLIIQDNGRISQKNYDLLKDKNGDYFEYGIMTKIYLKNFTEII